VGSERTAVAGGKRSSSHRLALLALLSPLLLVGCARDDIEQAKRLALPEPASQEAVEMGQLWDGLWLAAGVIGVFVWGLIIWAAVRYRRRDDDEVPVQNRYNLPIEVLYTVAPIIIIAVLFYFTIETQRQVLGEDYYSAPDLAGQRIDDAQRAEGEAHQIQVVGQKWAWTFNYLNEPAVNGDDVFDTGTPESFTELYLPVNEPVTFTLTSTDVIHSFWIPEFIFKLDVIPGKDNAFTVTPTREGTFIGRCAELCGIYHSRMLFDVHIVSREEYERHLTELHQAGQIGAPQGGSYSYTITGTEDEEEAP